MRFDVRRACALACTIAVAGLAACGGDDDESDPATAPEVAATETPAATEAPTEAPGSGDAGGAETLAVDATEDGGLGWDPPDLSAAAGEVTVEMANPDGNELPHAVALEGGDVDEAGEVVQPGGTSTVTVELPAGEYTFYCPVGSHRDQGMEGTLTVG